MGFLRKAAIISTGGLARAAIKPNSKKARIANATERQYQLERLAAIQEVVFQRQMLQALETSVAPPVGARLVCRPIRAPW